MLTAVLRFGMHPGACMAPAVSHEYELFATRSKAWLKTLPTTVYGDSVPIKLNQSTLHFPCDTKQLTETYLRSESSKSSSPDKQRTCATGRSFRSYPHSSQKYFSLKAIHSTTARKLHKCYHANKCSGIDFLVLQGPSIAGSGFRETNRVPIPIVGNVRYRHPKTINVPWHPTLLLLTSLTCKCNKREEISQGLPVDVSFPGFLDGGCHEVPTSATWYGWVLVQLGCAPDDAHAGSLRP